MGVFKSRLKYNEFKLITPANMIKEVAILTLAPSRTAGEWLHFRDVGTALRASNFLGTGRGEDQDGS